MANAIALLRGRAFQNRCHARTACAPAARPLEKVAPAVTRAAQHPSAPRILDILDRDTAPINQGWFWAMMKVFGGS